MTKDQWLALQPGDVITDADASNAPRTVLTVERFSGKRGQRGNTRTCFTVARLHGGRPVSLSSNDDVRGERFALVPHAAASDVARSTVKRAP